ncbi:MAG: dipeptidase [Patescibacteria group bacterium]
MRDILAFVDGNQEIFLNELKELLSIPSVSALSEHKADIWRCAEWLENHLRGIGFPRVEIFETSGHPIVYAEWLVDPSKPTVLSYGHYDVQPPDPLNEWTSPPFEPAIREGHIYARGTSDDKGQIFTHLKATQAFAETRGVPPVNIKLLIEGEEEVGSSNLEDFVRNHKDLLAADAVCISDTSIESLKVPCLTCGLRGLLYYEIKIRTANRDLHSGIYGGAAPNPLKFLSRLVALAESPSGKVLIPGFYDDVRQITDEDRDLIHASGFDEREFQSSIGAPFFVGEKEFSVPERLGLRPTFEVHGMPGGFTGEGSKTVIPAQAAVKVSMRLVPNQDIGQIDRIFRQWVADVLPAGLSAEIKNLGTGNWWVVDESSPVYAKARHALCEGFGAERTGAVFEGGSIPVVAMFSEVIGCPVVLLGFGLNEDNLHSPNERLALERFFGGIRTMIHFYDEIAKQ